MSSSGADLVHTIKTFMQGSEWQENIQIFVEANCSSFKEDPSSGFTHEQFKIWKNFQDICESILASALDDTAGCSMKDFERALEDLSTEPARGPREGVKRELLSQLLTYVDFHDFATMMNVAVVYQYPEKAAKHTETPTALQVEDVRVDNREENRSTLLQLSFPRNAVDYVIGNSVMDSSLDHLIDQLQNLPQEVADMKRPSARKDSSDMSLVIESDGMGAKDTGCYDEENADKFPSVENQEQLETQCIDAFAQEALQDSGELRAKFVIALSVLDSIDAGDMAGDLLEQLTWASAMCTLFQEIVLSFSSGVPFEQYCFTYSKGLLSWFDELDKAFFSLKIGLENGTAISEAELRRIVALEDLASMGTEDERLLHGLISRHEAVLKDLSALHGKCILLTSVATRGVHIKREHLEELYLYLKEQVNSGLDLSVITDEMYNQVSKLISSETSTEAVNLLLDIHVLEDEQILLKRQIVALLRDPSSKEEVADDEIEEISLFGKGSSNNGSGVGAAAGSTPGKESKTSYDHKSPDKAWTYDDRTVRDEDFNSKQMLTTSADRDGKVKLPPLVSPGKDYRGIRQEIKDKEDKEDLEDRRLSLIREQHRNGLKQLQNNLQDQRARAMKALERRMARRKRAEESAAAMGISGGDAGRNTRNVMEGDISESESDHIIIDLDEFDKIEEALVTGYKRRCVQETKLAKNNGGVLTKELAFKAKDSAAKELKQRHEEELKRLMGELAHSRDKERNRIKDMMSARRQKNRNNGNGGALQAEEERHLKEFEAEFDKKEAAALAEVQQQACIALAAAITSQSDDNAPCVSAIDALTGGSTLAAIANDAGSLSSNRRKGKDGDDDNYFESPPAKGSGSHTTDDIEQWLYKLREYSQSYGAVGASLTSKAQNARNYSDYDEPSKAIAPKILSVVLNACENQLNDEGVNFLSFSHGRHSKVENLDSIKARILDEFERSKMKSEMDADRANAERSSRLRKRRENRHKSRLGLGDADEDEIDIMGESEDCAEDEEGGYESDSALALAVDGLMDETAEDTMSSIVNIYDYAKSNGKSGGYRTDADKAEKEKLVAAEKEHKKELTDDLYAQMAMRKGNLEERLRTKRAKNNVSKSVAAAEAKERGGTCAVETEANDEDEDKLRKLELAFGLVTELVQGSHGSDLQKMDLDSLLGLIDHATKSKAEGGASDGKAKLHSAAPVSIVNNYRAGYEDLLKDIDKLLGSRGYGGAGGATPVDINAEREEKQRYKEHMDGIMQNRAKNLSDQYSVEKEKYDLRMKIEQARQQQSLQRKLLERRQSNAAARTNVSTGGAGYSSVAAGNLLKGMMSHAAQSKNGGSPVKQPVPDSGAGLKSRGLSTSNLFRK